jgi:hypothetical protein
MLTRGVQDYGDTPLFDGADGLLLHYEAATARPTTNPNQIRSTRYANLM